MRRATLILLAVLLAAPVLAQAAHEPWTQVGGGPGHAGVVRMAGQPLDVVASSRLIEAWFTRDEGGAT